MNVPASNGLACKHALSVLVFLLALLYPLPLRDLQLIVVAENVDKMKNRPQPFLN